VFSGKAVSDSEAQSLLERSRPNPTYSADFSVQSALSQNLKEEEEHDTEEAEKKVAESYEIMNVPPSRYLCSIPIVKAPAAENQTASELAKAEEAKELARASVRGWELLNALDGHCLYFMSGWWSYSFCYNREVVQFHAIPQPPNGQPPVKDPHSAEYVLGKTASPLATKKQQPTKNQLTDQTKYQGGKGPASNRPANTELQVKGDQRYLVQRLDKGTVCDLTGRDRTIEIQYHCVPGMKGDRIGWIKEVTTCAYLMVVNTPRLCVDAAFLPPRETNANPISCSLIIPTDDPKAQAEWQQRQELLQKILNPPPANIEAQQDQAPSQGKGAQQSQIGINIGGVVVGGQNVFGAADESGKAPPRLSPPRSYLPGRGAASPLVEVIASGRSKADGGKMEVLSQEELEKLDLNPELVEEMRREVQKLAGDKGWKLEVVEVPGDPREIRGVVDVDLDDESSKKQDSSEGSADADAGSGSEEMFFKEEL
jgi:protein OS-9